MYMKAQMKFGLPLLWKRRVAVMLLLSATSVLWPATARAVFKTGMEGQSAGSTNWFGGPLLNYSELDYVPLRTVYTGGPATNQAMSITFDHTKGTAPGIQFLTGFSNSANVIITSPVTLNAPAGVDIWSYNFTVTVTDGATGFVYFFARLSAGSHAFPGAALSLKINGGGQTQIKQPAVVLGSPDLAITKTGPSQAKTNQIITYVIQWTNKLIAAQTALGVQVSDFLPAEVSYVPGSASKGATIVG